MGSQKIAKKTIDAAVADLKQLPVKQKESFALREAIYEMRKDLEAILRKGYTYEEVAEFLSSREIKIKPVTLKQYLSSFKRKAKRTDAEQKDKDKASSVQGEQVMGQSQEKRVNSQSEVKSRGGVGTGDGFVDIPDDL